MRTFIKLLLILSVVNLVGCSTTKTWKQQKPNTKHELKKTVKVTRTVEQDKKENKAIIVTHTAKPTATKPVNAPQTVEPVNTTEQNLKPFKVRGLNPDVLKEALRAKENAAKRGIQSKPVMAIIDYSLPSNTKRLWLIDTNNKKVLKNTYVAHGKKSGHTQVVKYSNAHGSHQTSIGLFQTGNVYRGKHGNSLELHGLEHGVNHNAYARRIVMHSSDYVNDSIAKSGRLGRSLGCPAVSHKDAPVLINALKNGALVFAYYPDKQWLKTSKFLG